MVATGGSRGTTPCDMDSITGTEGRTYVFSENTGFERYCRIAQETVYMRQSGTEWMSILYADARLYVWDRISKCVIIIVQKSSTEIVHKDRRYIPAISSIPP